jgi:hypothetical protein
VAVGPEIERRKRPSRATARNGSHPVEEAELEQLLHALQAARDGNFSLRLPVNGTGIAADLRRAFNELADRREAFSK